MKYVFISKTGAEIVPIIFDQHIWVTGRDIGYAFNLTPDMINKHSRHLESTGQFSEEGMTLTFPVTQLEGGRPVTRQIKHYSPKAVYLVAMRSNSPQAYEFQMWAAEVLYRLRRDGVVYADHQPAALQDTSELDGLKAELDELKRQMSRMQAIMDGAGVPHLSGIIEARIGHLCANQKKSRRKPPTDYTSRAARDRILGMVEVETRLSKHIPPELKHQYAANYGFDD